jgi:Leishmanolysin
VPFSSNLTVPLPIAHLQWTGIGLGIWLSKNAATANNWAPPCNYIGTNANREFANISGCTGGAVPLEQGGGEGTLCNHWSEACLGQELMTPTSGGLNQLSRITVGSLHDMGYQVDYSKADSFTKADLAPSCTCPARRLRGQDQSPPGEMDGATSEGFSSSHPPRRHLSEAAKAQAIEAGLKYLDTRAQLANHTVLPPGVKYVGDKAVSVLMMEDGEIHGVLVTR